MADRLDLTVILDLLGTFAFAISGIRLAARKNFDWFGAYVIGLATAIGGGTIRDLLQDVPPIWLADPRYLLTTGAALLACIIFKGEMFRWSNTLFLFDAIGLGLFTVTGITKSLAMGLPVWTCIIMGTISGSVGGVIRDVLINEVPLIFRKDLYAIACILGGVAYFGVPQIEALHPFREIIAALTVIFVRVLAVKFHLGLPKLNMLETKK
jgi:uncharacterized membrane protein YeiH